MTGLSRGHYFDEDAVCMDCGFDGAEWHHWKHHTYEGRASNCKPPLCTHIGRPTNEYAPRPYDFEEDSQ